MTSASTGTESLAKTLVDARRSGARLDPAPAAAPTTLGEAYAVQDAYIAAMAEPVVGWKVGLTNKAAQQANGIDEPIAGPLFRSAVVPSPATLQTPAEALRLVECEFGFRLANDLPPRAAPYDQQAAAEAVATLHPAVEVVDIHVPGGLQAGPRWAIADGGGNHYWVPGEGSTDWRIEELPSLAVEVSLNGASQGRGTAAAALGNPLTVVAWLANHLVSRGLHLKAGDWISTGLCTPLFAAAPGDAVDADYAGLGAVRIQF